MTFIFLILESYFFLSTGYKILFTITFSQFTEDIILLPSSYFLSLLLLGNLWSPQFVILLKALAFYFFVFGELNIALWFVRCGFLIDPGLELIQLLAFQIL